LSDAELIRRRNAVMPLCRIAELPNCLLVSDLIDLNSIIGEETELKEVDHGEKEFEIDDIISNVGYLGSN